MKTLTELRNTLKKAEAEYRTAWCSLDGSLDLIYKKEQLKIARFEYKEACEIHIEELYFCEDGA